MTEWMPSAPTSRSPVASVPSSKLAVTVPSAPPGHRQAATELDRDPAADRLVQQQPAQTRALHGVRHRSVRQRCAEGGPTQPPLVAVPQDIAPRREARPSRKVQGTNGIERVEPVRRDGEVGPDVRVGSRARFEDRRLDACLLQRHGGHRPGNAGACNHYLHPVLSSLGFLLSRI